MLGVWQGSAAQQAEEMVPDGVRVVSALHTVERRALADVGPDLDEDVLVCGDRRADKAQAAEILAAHPGPALRRRRAARDVAHHRVA